MLHRVTPLTFVSARSVFGLLPNAEIQADCFAAGRGSGLLLHSASFRGWLFCFILLWHFHHMPKFQFLSRNLLAFKFFYNCKRCIHCVQCSFSSQVVWCIKHEEGVALQFDGSAWYMLQNYLGTGNWTEVALFGTVPAFFFWGGGGGFIC